MMKEGGGGGGTYQREEANGSAEGIKHSKEDL